MIPMLLIWLNIPKTALPMGYQDPSLMHSSLDPLESTFKKPNGILIGSTVFAGLMVVTTV